ncbi:uncharacterized protein LOC116195647 isoform X2 [Punica granatum]|uniref:DUF7798 domain-containing protein n=2 Tax=Punica granatum TaxID=22663 RepID=A0A218X3A5_PUNGR|nr:uncharacterized protein LOC116195647 isoform X2 [Punica granatum]OWM79278.1 hypothetical protein CDL15_Pgr003450 [Punica granatum]PKI50239.1 hypothetical protein CRG98_029312 [Punica granatum]
MEDKKQPLTKEAEEAGAEAEPKVEARDDASAGGGGGGGWGGWGFSPLSLLSDLQKAAEEISRNAAEVAKNAAKSVSDVPDADENSEASKEEEGPEKLDSDEEKDEEDKLRKSALNRLENASEDTFLGQGLKVLDSSVENFASGAWQALGSAWKGGTDFVQKLEHSAVNIAGSLQQGGTAGSAAPSLLETGKAFTAKGIQVLEYVGKETMDLLITETGNDVEKNSKRSNNQAEDDQLFEEVTFDRCFYIYGGPEQLEELEVLSNHCALLVNRRKAKLPSEQKSLYDGKLKEIQQIFDMSSAIDWSGSESDKGKKIDNAVAGNGDEIKKLHDSSVKQAADMAAGFTNAITGLAASEVTQKTTGRLETLHSEGVHRLSEMCCFAVTQLLMLGKSIISDVNKVKDNDDGETLKLDWPEDSVEKAKLIRTKAQLMTDNVEAVSRSFITGISDVAEAYLAAIKRANADLQEASPQAPIQEKAKAFSEHLQSDQGMAVGKIQDGLQYLSYLVISSAMPPA